MKTRLVLILTSSVAIVAAALFVIPSLLSLRQVTFEKEKGLAEGKAIAIRTQVDGFGVRKGDTFSYSVEVKYNLELVSDIDKTSVDKSVDFKPFEIRNVAEREFDLHPRTRALVREYQIQLIDGKINQLYKFPAIVVRYKSKVSDTYEEKAITPDPVFVGSRLPAETAGLELKPIQGGIEDVSRSNLHKILLALGGFLAIVALVDLAWRVVPQWREAKRQRRRAEGLDIISEAYRSLRARVGQGAEPKHLLHQMGHILRIVLTRKENVGWLDEPNLDQVAPDIKAEVLSLLDQCQSTDGNPSAPQKQVQDALGHLEKILEFYLGREEMQAWER